MKNLTRTICLTLAVLLGSLVTGCGADLDSGADFDKGLVFYKSGDYATALGEWRPLAEQGNADAQMLLAELYYNGYGVLEDLGHFENYVYAYMWGDIAASNGNFLIFFVKKGNSGYWRDKAASWIPDEIAKAKKLVSECVAKKYKGC